MEQITGYAIIGAIVVGLVVIAWYLRASNEFILKIEEDKPNPPTELKLEVVKDHPAKKKAVKKTAAKSTAKKKTKTTTIKPT